MRRYHFSALKVGEIMQFEHTDPVRALIARLEAFFDEHIYPNEKAVSELVTKREGKARRQPIPLVEQLKPRARAAGLWNMFLRHSASGAGLTNLGRMELEGYR